jgi:hypothetical protein
MDLTQKVRGKYNLAVIDLFPPQAAEYIPN